jgi:hypothetical protein
MARRRPLGLALAFVVALLAIVPPGMVAAGGRFTDDDGSRYESAIEQVAAAGVMPGCSTHHFCPKTLVTKGRMAVYVARAFRLTATVKTKFKDVPSSLRSGVDKTVAAKLFSGCSTTQFCPDSAITRGRLASLIVKALHLSATGAGRYKDVPRTHNYAVAIERLRTAGLAITCGSNLFCPDRRITRQETAAFLARVMARPRVVPPPPVAGNPDGTTPIPPEGQAVDTSHPDHVVGTGTPTSCTGAAVVAAVAQGGIITFDCGPAPVSIPMTATGRTSCSMVAGS